MTNPLVAFGSHHKCRARGFAGGGSVDDAKAVGDRMCKEYGVGCKPKAVEASAPAPQTQAAPSPAPSSGGMIGAVKNIFANRAAQIDRAVEGYANGGVIRDGNSFTQDLTNYNPLTALAGPKDRFGNDMTFTNGMRSQIQDIAAPSAPVMPTTQIQPAAQNPLTSIASPQTTSLYTPGSANDPHKAFSRGGMIKGPGTPTSDSIPARVEETGEEVSVSTDERILSKAQDAFLEKLAKDLGFESLEEMLEAGTGQPVGPTINAGQRGAATGGKFDETRDYSIPADQLAEAQTAIAAAPAPVVETPPPSPAERFKNPDFSMIGADRKGYEQARKMYAPDAPTAAEASAQIVAQKPALSRGLPTPISDASLNYAASTPTLGDQGRGVPTGHNPPPSKVSNPLTTIDMNANNASLARANEIRQSIGDATGPRVMTLGDSGRAESQALMDKWGREDAMKEMVAEMGRNPKAANALASLYHSQQGTETALAGVDNQRDIAAATDSTQRRGQDIAAQTHFAQLAGNPIDNALKRTQLTSANMAIDKAREHDKVLANIHAETDPAKRQALIEGLLAGQGKNVNEHRFIKVDGGEETNDLGVKYKKPSGVFDAVTKQFIPMTATQNSQSFTKADVDKALSSGADRKAVAERIKQMGGNPADYGLI